MASATAAEDGTATQKTKEHYVRLSQAGAGLLIVEYTFVHPTGRSEENQLGISKDEHIRGLSVLAEAIHQSKALAGIQLTHGGGKSERSFTGGVLMGPSAISVPVKDRLLEVPDLMSKSEIELWKQAFVDASDRAVLAGFDLIELHSAHGYGLNQWLSPITNQRSDAYGGSLEGRIKLLLEIIQAVRDRHPSLVISVRMPGQDFMEKGLEIGDTITIAQALEKAGVTILHISSGIGGWRRPAPRSGEGYFVLEAEQIQAAVQIPVIGVGGIESGDFIDESLRAKRFQLAAVGRAILKNPRVWSQANLSTEWNSRVLDKTEIMKEKIAAVLRNAALAILAALTRSCMLLLRLSHLSKVEVFGTLFRGCKDTGTDRYHIYEMALEHAGPRSGKLPLITLSAIYGVPRGAAKGSPFLSGVPQNVSFGE